MTLFGFRLENKITVITNSGIEYEAKLVCSDPVSDISLLKIEPREELKAIKFGKYENLRPGQFVLAIGCPLSLSISFLFIFIYFVNNFFNCNCN